jgi:hypothetical protein
MSRERVCFLFFDALMLVADVVACQARALRFSRCHDTEQP